jgi:hypothetical protein
LQQTTRLPEPNEYLNMARDIKEASEEIVSETGGSEFGAVSGWGHT